MFTFIAAIRGFHIYRHSWTPRIGQLPPTIENRLAIAVVDVIDSSQLATFPENLVEYSLIQWTAGGDRL